MSTLPQQRGAESGFQKSQSDIGRPAMSSSPFVPFYTSDFLGGTSGMTASTKGVYITLLCLMYEAEGPLTQSLDTLARRCGCTLPALKKAIEALEDDGKLTVSDDGIWSQKCEKHITQRRERSDSARSAAKSRWKKTFEKQGKPDATAVQTQCKPEPQPYITSPIGDDGNAVDARSQAIWKRGVPFLSENGVPEKQARSLIGKWLKEHGSEAVFEALKDAAKAGTGDPVPYITEILKPVANVADLVASVAASMKMEAKR